MTAAPGEVLPLALLLFGLGFTGANALRYSGGRRLFRTPPPQVIVALALLSALAALTAPGHPTASAAVDAVAKALVGAGVATVGLRARRWSLVGGSVVVAVAAVAGGVHGGVHLVGLACALASVGIASTLRLHHRRSPILGGIAAALLTQAALRLPTSLPARVPSLAAALGIGIVVFSGIRNGRTATQRRLRRAALGLGVLAVAAAAGGVLALVQSGPDARAGIDGARLALSRAEAADATGSLDQLHAAGRRLAAIRRRTGAWWARPALAVPVLGQHVDAVDRLAGSATDVVAAAEQVAGSARVDDLRLAGGRVDLAALRAVADPLDALGTALGSLEDGVRRAHGPWLVAPLTHEVDRLDSQLDRARKSTDSLREALAAVPALLGADGPRRYLLVVPTPAEARASGGVIGNYGEITAVDGAVALARFGRTDDLKQAGTPAMQRTLTSVPADYLARYTPFEANALWQNTNMSPDFPSAAMAMANLYPQSGGQPVDGVLSVDPIGLAALLQVIGPVSVPLWDEPITADNAAQVLLYDVYLKVGDSKSAERAELLAQVSQAVWARLAAMALPAPTQLASALGPAARGRHIQFWSTRPGEQAWLEKLGVTGAVPPVQGDFLGVAVNNASANKIEWFLHRDVRYQADYDPATGEVRSRVRVALRNDAPAKGLPKYLIGNFISPDTPLGTSRLYVSIYSPLGLRGARLDGDAVRAEEATELNRQVYSFWVTIPATSTRTLELDLVGQIEQPDRGYRLDVMHQPVVWPDDLHVDVRTGGGWRVVRATGLEPGPDGASASVQQREGSTFRVEVAPPASEAVSR